MIRFMQGLTRSQLPVLSIVFCAVFAVLFFAFFGGGKKSPTREAGPELAKGNTPAASSTESWRDGAEGRALEDSPQSGSRDAEIPGSQKKTIDEGLAQILASLHEAELANKNIIYENQSPEFHTVRLRVVPPNVEQLGRIYGGLSRALEALPPGSPAEKQMRERGMELINRFVLYPKPVKVLGFGERNDGTIADFFEWYVADEKMLMPNEKGMLPIPLPPQAVMRSDPDISKPDSWAAKRYSHLFSIDK